jgi:hypothetical protein
MKAVILKIDGTTSVAEFKSETSYAALSIAVGGYIERVRLLAHNIEMYLNEEGKIHRLPINEKATALWVASYGETDVICGDVVLIGLVDPEGENESLTDEQVKTFLAL